VEGDGAVASTLNLYFALTSASGLYSLSQIASWQDEAGLQRFNSIRFLSMPGWQVAMATRTM
jgi:hypothetical protein